MLLKTSLRAKWSILPTIMQYGFKYFSENYTKVANEAISNYADIKILRTLKKKDYSYIIDSNVAESIADYISQGWKDGVVLEVNPGPGIISSHMLKNGIKSLRVFEQNSHFLPALTVLKNDYPNLDIIKQDLLFLPVFESKACYEPEIVNSLFQNLPHHRWTEGISFRFFSIISNKRGIKFLRYLFAVLPTKSSIFALGRCELFILTTEPEFMYMKAVPKENFSMYRWATVLYNLFFEIKCLRKFSSEILFPKKNFQCHKKGNCNSNTMYFVQLTPRIDLFSNIVYQNRLGELYYFVRHHLVKRRALVIPTLEHWVPLCGPRLIKNGMNVFTRFGDLSPNQILLLFNQFSSWPEYADSAFIAAASRYLDRQQIAYEDGEKLLKNVD